MPPRKTTQQSPIPVESVHHADKRTNIPTADAHYFVTEEAEQSKKLLYPRDTSLDPQLVWKGKDEQDEDDLVVDAPPIYIQEKIDPRVLVENLRRTSKKENEPELEELLFDYFDGLDELAAVDFYHHDANWSNRMILGDSLQVMGSLAERENLRGKVQMVYIDPPYGIKFGSNFQVSTQNRDVKDGRLSDAAREAEQIKAFRDTWELGIHSYLSYLRDRLVATRDLLTESGSVFVQIGDENQHLVRNLLDEVFGSQNFIANINYVTTSGRSAEFLDVVNDSILWYGKDIEQTKHRRLWKPRSERTVREQYTRLLLADGKVRSLTRQEKEGSVPLPAGSVRYMPGDMSSSGAGDSDPHLFEGRLWSIPPNTHWKTNSAGRKRLEHAGRLVGVGNRLRYMRLETDFPWAPYTNVWDDTVISGFADPKFYVVQTSVKVVERCILLATDPGDLVLDPTCGSGTSAYVSEQWGRRWITIDTSRVALALARQRIMAAKYPYYVLADSAKGVESQYPGSFRSAGRSDVQGDIRQGFVYERAQRITLGGIANNPDITDGMSREEADAAIRRHAEFEPMVNRPREDKDKVRVAGPFTVESLTPHRSVTFDEIAPSTPRDTISSRVDEGFIDDQPFEQSILDNLLKAGVQNGKKAERLVLNSIETYPGTYMQAVGTTDTGEPDRRVGLAIGPQYGTVSPAFIKKAAKEAIAAGDIDILCVFGFAFDPQATSVTKEDGVTVDASDAGFAEVAGERTLGKVKVLFVRMNSDLLMGEELKKTGSGNLFTVFGEPDIDITTEAGMVTVDLKGVDVFDPTTGEVRSGGTDKIALWMIDTAYNEESFFVRHCYFTGGGDPFKKLKITLKEEINAEAWDSLYSTTSRAFEKPETGKIAVKVINDYGDEVMKVFNV